MAGILEQSMGARKQVGIGLSCRPPGWLAGIQNTEKGSQRDGLIRIRVEAMEGREARVMSGIGVGNERISCLIKLKLFGGKGAQD
jgi:hypothetical protein